jgi:hypothetical protein
MKDIFTQICEEPLNRRLIDRYLPWGTGRNDDSMPLSHEPLSNVLLGLILDELRPAASLLRDHAVDHWWPNDDVDDTEKAHREKLGAVFNLLVDKVGDLETLCEFAGATFGNDPNVLERVRRRMAELPGPCTVEQNETGHANPVN